MRVGSPSLAGSQLRRLLLLVACLLAVPATARAQDPAPVTFERAPSGVTSSTSETISFSAEGLSAFSCSTDGGPFVSCGSPATVEGLVEGSHTFAVRGLGPEGVILAAGQVSWVVDRTAPSATITAGPSGPTPVGRATFTFASSDADFSRFRCELDGESFQCKTPMEVEIRPGTHTLSVRAVDAAGNVGEPDSRTWTGQEPSPPPPAPELSGPSELVATREALFTFSAEGAERFECSVDSGPPFACTTGTRVVVPADGLHTFAVRGIAAGGAAGDASLHEWTVDTLAPSVTIAPPPGRPQDVTKERQATFVFGSDDATATLACSLDRGAYAACTSGQTFPVGPGDHTLTVRATDRAGNIGTATDAWFVDDVAPAVTFAVRPAPITNSPAAEFRLRSETGSTLSCKLVGPGRTDDFAPCADPQRYAGLGSGDYTLEVAVVDEAGNPGTGSYSWRVDRDAPTVAFTATPPAVTTAPAAALAVAAGEDGATLRCSLDGGAFTPCSGVAAVPNTVLGAHTFDVQATDLAGNTGPAARAAWTASFAAAFDWAPAAAVIDQPVTFTSRAQGAIAGQAWDVDGDGEFDDGTGESVQRTFAQPGSYMVRLRVTHASGAAQVAETAVAVGRTPLITDPPVTVGPGAKAPVASFGWAPQAPVAGQEVRLTSTSSDPDGTIATSAWDLDGDGQFDDATGPSAVRAFPAGTHVVGLRVTDADDLAATSFATVVVEPAPGTPKPPTVTPGPKALTPLAPFPTVRIAGTAVGGQIRLRILAVKAPRNTTVDVRCSGRGCPFKLDRHTVGAKARIVRIRRLEGRILRAGTVLEVRVHASGRIGKYTRVFFRAGAAPKRTDACVSGTRLAKVACPA